MKTLMERVCAEPENMIYNALHRELQPGYVFESHRHRNVEICMMTEGECDIGINGQIVTVHAGEILLIFPLVLHSFCVSAKHAAKFLQVHFCADCWRPEKELWEGIEILSWLFEEKSTYLLCPFSKEMQACMENICFERNNLEGALHDELARMYLRELVLLLSREMTQGYRHTFNIKDPLLIGAVQYISQTIDQRITSTEVARACHVSQRQIARLFKVNFNMTLNEYVNVVKVEKAMTHLTDGRLSISEIGERLGFSSTQYFSTVFKRITHVTPKEYRSRTVKNI